LFLFLAGIEPLFADVRLPAIISDHMVLQKSDRGSVWGWADPGEKVRATFAGQTAETTAGHDGAWRVTLNLTTVSPAAGSQKLTIEGKNKIEIADVLVGEVWVASGQSNMEFPLREAIGADDELAHHTTPQLREFRVPKMENAAPQDDCRWNRPWGAKWVVSDPQQSAGFSAIAYYFGRQLVDHLHSPVGIINASYAGTPIEACISQEALDKDAELKEGSAKGRSDFVAFPSCQATYIQAITAWIEATGRRDPRTSDPAPFLADDAAPGWQPVNVPGRISGGSLPEAGVFWLRRDIAIQPDMANKPQNVEIGDLRAFESVYWNGKKIGEMDYRHYPGDGFHHHYALSADAVKQGTNRVAIRIYSPLGTPEILGNADIIKVAGQSLVGRWSARAEASFPPLPPDAPPRPEPLIQRSAPQYVASYLFNAMIHPILPYTMRGVIWYQGENNVGRAYQYRRAFPMMIQDWRAQWGEGDFPFNFCQLAALRPKSASPEESNWAELREAQSQALALPHTGEAILIDAGESDNIHPRDKRTPGERLAAIALANTYCKSVPFSGPVYQSMTTNGSTVQLGFLHAEGGLVAKPLPDTYLVSSKVVPFKTGPLVRNSPGSELEGFAICGADHKWVWAEAAIEGATVKVWSPQVPRPIAVRYAWDFNPTCNLYNGSGFPSSPFRTDDFPDSTLNAKY
jgi:sialate O-acetylesterase